MANVYSVENTTEFLQQYKNLEAIEINNPKLFEKFKENNFYLFEMLRHIRNDLAHNVSNNSYPFAVSDSLLESLENLLFRMNAKVIDNCILENEIYKAKLFTPIHEVITMMNKKNYTYVPVLDDQKRVKLVISEKSILDLLSDSKDGILYDNTVQVKDFMSYFELENNDNEYFNFVSRKSLATDAKESFAKMKNGKKCGVIFITESGKKEEAIVGMATVWDLFDL